MRGLRIELGEIEHALEQYESIQDAVTLVQNDALVAYIVSTETTVDRQSIRTSMRQYLPDYMIPSVYMKLDAMPLTPNGKIDRKALPEPDYEQMMSNSYVAPSSETEKQLVEIWSEILDVDKVGVQDNFFDIGGHSLMATQVISKIREVFQCEIPLRDIFDEPNIENLAKIIDEVLADGGASSVESIQRIDRSIADVDDESDEEESDGEIDLDDIDDDELEGLADELDDLDDEDLESLLGDLMDEDD